MPLCMLIRWRVYFSRLSYLLFHVNCFSKFKPSKQTIWEIRENPNPMSLLGSYVLYGFSKCIILSHWNIVYITHFSDCKLVTLIHDFYKLFCILLCLRAAFLITGCSGYGGVCFWSREWHIAHRMSEGLASAVCALCLCSGMNTRGCLMALSHPLSGWKRAAPRPSTVYLPYSQPCMLGRERAVVMRDSTTRTHAHEHTGSAVGLSETGNIPNSIRAHSIRARIGCDSHSHSLFFLFCPKLFPLMHRGTDTIAVKHFRERDMLPQSYYSEYRSAN